MEKNPSFLKKKYDLHNAPEVASAAKRTETKAKSKNKALVESGQEGPLQQEVVPTKPEARIQNYLDRFKEIIERPDPTKRERGLEAVKNILHKEYIVDTKTATEQYIKRQKRIAHEQGHGELNIPPTLQSEIEGAAGKIVEGVDAEFVLGDFPNEQKQLVEEVVALVEEQKGSLDQWVDYLASPDATYPDWLKYWAMRNIVGLAKYDKDAKVFPKRTDKTANPFPDLNREALAYVLDAIEKKYDGKSISLDQLEEQDRTIVEKLIASENFAKLYGWAIEKLTPASEELLAVTDGKWVKFKQGSDALRLAQSLQSHSTGWCTAGESVAQSQLSRGDFHVYYSLDEQGKPTIPRAAIRMEGKSIAEVRGIAPEQNLDAHIAPVVAEKLHEFPEGKAYEKKASDMKQLTRIEHHVQLGKALTKDDLIFLYEINSPIEGFGYERDPRIAELLKNRDPKADAPTVLECNSNQIAWNKKEITEHTKAYIGPLFPGIFKKIASLEHIYISFPEGKIRQTAVEVSGKTGKDYESSFKKAGMNISDYAKHMLQNMPPLEMSEPAAPPGLLNKVKDLFAKKEDHEVKQTERIDTVCLTVKDLGFSEGATTDQIYKQAEQLGLELCPAQVGPEFRLQYKNQPLNEWVFIGMKQIPGPGGFPFIFNVAHLGEGRWLDDSIAEPSDHCFPDYQFLFRLRK